MSFRIKRAVSSLLQVYYAPLHIWISQKAAIANSVQCWSAEDIWNQVKIRYQNGQNLLTPTMIMIYSPNQMLVCRLYEIQCKQSDMKWLVVRNSVITMAFNFGQIIAVWTNTRNMAASWEAECSQIISIFFSMQFGKWETNLLLLAWKNSLCTFQAPCLFPSDDIVES